jgi:hypothetical protein
MAADPWKVYGAFIEGVAKADLDLNGHTFKIILVTSAYTPNQSGHSVIADVSSNEASNYTRPTLANVTVTRSGLTTTFDADDVTITASGGNCTFRYAVIYDDTPTGDPLVAYCLLDNTPANVTISNGNSLILQFNTNGIIQFTTS